MAFLGEGFGVRFRWVVGGGLLWKMREMGKGVGRVGGGLRAGEGTGKSMRTLFSKLPFSNLPFGFSPTTLFELPTDVTVKV